MHLDNEVLYHAFPALAILFLAELIFLIKEHRHDKKDMLTSFALALVTIPISFITTGIIILVFSLVYQFRLFTIPADRWWAWILLFFADDISYYWYHRMSHQIRFLWASHMVHHSSENFNLASGLRVPWTSNLTGTFLFWAWMPLIGIEPAMIIAMKSISVIYQFWVHTEAIKKLPKWYEAIFNTPSHHRVHHSSDIEYLDKNHAGTLIIWDKVFGTFQEETFKPKYGLTENIKSFNPFVIAFYEWKNIFRDLKRSESIKHRLYYLFKQPGWSHNGNVKTAKHLQSQLNSKRKEPVCAKRFALIKYVALLFFTGSFFYTDIKAQERKLVYDVIRNGDIIGKINYVELTQGQKKFLSFNSDVKTRFILSFCDYSSETAAYDNGIMVYSSFYQKQNGSEKANKKTIASGECYKLMVDGVLKSISCSPIRYNMLLLYINIPGAITKVYSDNFQKHLDIIKVEENKYRLSLPDGNYNYYTYKNGVCSKVDIKRTLFTIHFVLKENSN